MNMWKVVFGRNVDTVKVEADTIVQAIGKARKWSDEHLPLLDADGEAVFSDGDRAITSAELLFSDWLR